MGNRQLPHEVIAAHSSSLTAPYERTHLLLVTHLRTRRIPLWIRYGRHFWRGKNNSGVVGSYTGRSWHCHGFRALWHRRWLSAGRLAGGSLWAQSYAALDRHSLSSGCRGIS